MDNPKKQLAIIGNPIAHSHSPLIHHALSKLTDQNYTYTPYQVEPQNLREWLEFARETHICGFNVTIPHKTTIIPLLDQATLEAKTIGAVNTVVQTEGKLSGYNTDTAGFLLALKEKNYSLQDKNALILGSGGVAKAVAFACMSESAKITIISIDQSTAKEIQDQFSLPYNPINIVTWNLKNLIQYASKADILIQATPLGMKHFNCDFENLDFLKELPSHALVYDLIYTPKTTKLLAEAKSLGLNTINGLPMLIYQAILAYEIFTGLTLDHAALAKKIKQILQKELGE